MVRHAFEVAISVPRKARDGSMYTVEHIVQTIGRQRAEDWAMSLARRFGTSERAVTITRLKKTR